MTAALVPDKPLQPPEPTVESLLASRSQKSTFGKFAEDAVYTLNHALVCLTFDLGIAPAVGNWTQKYLGKRIEIWHSHDHGHDDHHHHHDHHGHEHHHHHHHDDHFWHWFVGEALGDLAAVPVTVGVNHAAPNLARGIQAVSEPFMGPIFRLSADRQARKWGYDHGFDARSVEVQARAREIYDHEVDHLPHAFVWTAFSSIFNISFQRLLGNNKDPIWVLAASKVPASMMPLGVTLALRAAAPQTIQKLMILMRAISLSLSPALSQSWWA
jgi:hypothetical protein